MIDSVVFPIVHRQRQTCVQKNGVARRLDRESGTRFLQILAMNHMEPDVKSIKGPETIPHVADLEYLTMDAVATALQHASDAVRAAALARAGEAEAARVERRRHRAATTNGDTDSDATEPYELDADANA